MDLGKLWCREREDPLCCVCVFLLVFRIDPFFGDFFSLRVYIIWAVVSAEGGLVERVFSKYCETHTARQRDRIE
jgi:hypothetical protein